MVRSSLDEDHVPGTVYLVDVAGTSAVHDASRKDIVLVPRPSLDPEDPLNWSHRRKILAVSMAYLYVFGTGIATSLQYSVLANITADTGISTANLVQGTGVMFLFFGWACLIWQPIALSSNEKDSGTTSRDCDESRVMTAAISDKQGLAMIADTGR